MARGKIKHEEAIITEKWNDVKGFMVENRHRDSIEMTDVVANGHTLREYLTMIDFLTPYKATETEKPGLTRFDDDLQTLVRIDEPGGVVLDPTLCLFATGTSNMQEHVCLNRIDIGGSQTYLQVGRVNIETLRFARGELFRCCEVPLRRRCR